MSTITNRTDIITYLNDVRADLGDEYTQAVCDQIQASDHPAWGQDWSEWLSAELPAMVEALVDGLVALETPDACRGAEHGCSCGGPDCQEYADAEPAYRLVVGERGNEQGHVVNFPIGTSEQTARTVLAEMLTLRGQYHGDGWGRVEYQRGEGWDRLD